MIQVRKAETSDYDAVMALLRQLNPADPVVADRPGRAMFEHVLNSDANILLVAERQAEVVATCYLNVIPNLTRSLHPYAVIENVVTDEAVRGEGIGKSILAEAINLAQGLGCYKVMLMTGRKDEAVNSFYRSCGFSQDEKQAFVLRIAQNT